ncbi:MAG: UDP-N-acetylmuramate dehydrogenase [Candidatus Yanofskybacteria bacterium]|nr:UDP-N-acetylmuramate dehydrogenase [Candidatus Yanofskybacteria bacterium]
MRSVNDYGKLMHVKIRKNVKLARYTTFHVGGPAEFFAEVNSVGEVKGVVDFVKKNKLKLFILGGGSNVLLPDKGMKGLVLKVNIKGIKFRNNLTSAGAGEIWDNIVAKAVAKGLSGIENLSLIPGTVGGAVYQNIGAYGMELKDVLDSVEVFDIKSLAVKRFSNKKCYFGYRQSIFQQSENPRYIILEAGLKLSKNYVPNVEYPDLVKYFGSKKASLSEMRKAIIKIRKTKLVYPSDSIGTAGSFFKNPIVSSALFNKIIKQQPDIKGRETDRGRIKLFAGQLVEEAGWKGKRLGSVGASEKHSMVLVSYKGGKAVDIVKLSNLIRKSVKDKFGVDLEPEVKIMA